MTARPGLGHGGRMLTLTLSACADLDPHAISSPRTSPPSAVRPTALPPLLPGAPALPALSLARTVPPDPVGRSPCPTADPPALWGEVADGGVTELSGVVASLRDDDAYWVHDDGAPGFLLAISGDGATLSEHTLPDGFSDLEDLAVAIDPAGGRSTLFLGDLGDNGLARDEVAVWVAEEPDPRADGALDPLRMGLVYPDGPHDAEALIADPATFDLYVLTKSSDGAGIYRKRAPHDPEGPFLLEALGAPAALDLVVTGADASPDGTLVVVRDYTDTAWMWLRSGRTPFELAFEGTACPVPIAGEPQGEAVGFTADGAGVLTVSEGTNQPLWFVGLRWE